MSWGDGLRVVKVVWALYVAATFAVLAAHGLVRWAGGVLWRWRVTKQLRALMPNIAPPPGLRDRILVQLAIEAAAKTDMTSERAFDRLLRGLSKPYPLLMVSERRLSRRERGMLQRRPSPMHKRLRGLL